MNDDTLILYYYRDGLSKVERRRVQASLEADVSLRARYEQLCNDLAQLEAPEPMAVAPDVTARWHDSIDRAARAERQRAKSSDRGFHFPSFAWGTGVAAVLVAGIVIKFYIAGNQVSEPLVDTDVTDAVFPDMRSQSDAFARGLQVHLRDSRQELTELPMDAHTERAMLIMQMIRQNRMFERAAEHNDAEDLARVLRAFEFILVRLASDDITAEDAEALQTQLAFELDVMLTKLGRNASDVTGPI
ncbi:MAG: hypothetical protein H0W33_05995 [Gammaproteobacteria bacterium]|nr:hypothetical protein [Gammaproteobacteria bacterium]